jgi:hypothetical protein
MRGFPQAGSGFSRDRDRVMQVGDSWRGNRQTGPGRLEHMPRQPMRSDGGNNCCDKAFKLRRKVARADPAY